MKFFLDNPNRSFVGIYTALLDMLVLSEGLSLDELEIASQLVESMLELGIEDVVYAQCLANLRDLISENNSPKCFDWMLNIAELLVVYPDPDDGHLKTELFAVDVISAMRKGLHRVTQTQRKILTLLAEDFGAASLLESFPEPEVDEEEAESNDFDGLIGIYTLMEGAGKRAKEILNELLPNARVETNKDGVATSRLTALAKNADIFVFSWKASKHQAYYCVKDARSDRDIIMPSGKGTASIVREVMSTVS